MAQVALCGCIASQIPRAWECFITDQYPTIFNIANLYAQNRRYHEHDLADWFGYAYDRLHDGRRLGQFEGKSSLRTYLYRRGSGVVYRLFLDWLRTRREDIPGGDIVDNVKARDDPETQAYHRQQIERVHQATGRLTAVRRIAFLVPDFAEALTDADYLYLAEINGAAPGEMEARAAQMRERVAHIVMQASTDEDLASLLYPSTEEMDLQKRTTAELRLQAQLLEGVTEVDRLQRLELLGMLRQGPNPGRVNKLHSARRYARADLRDALDENK